MEWTSCLRRQIACMCIDEIEGIDEIGYIALVFGYILYINVYLLMIC